MRIGFLFNHYAAHQVPQAAPIAFELSRRFPDIDVVIAFSSDDEGQMLERISGFYPGHRCRTMRLQPVWWYPLVDPLVSRFSFHRKKRVLKDNLPFFSTLDALVAPERHCRYLKTRYGLGTLPLIHVRHGAGDRKVSKDQHMAQFDLVLLPGQKYADRFLHEGQIVEGGYAVIGWPKFDVARALHPGKARLFRNNNPVVVYNPHFDHRVGSYGRMGLQVLDYFVEHPAYNLIFTPHVVMFRRRWRHRARLPGRYRSVPNILIDTGSPASYDMTYMLAADVYLGDISSQVYEFLLTPRPCVFLNAHRIAWQDDPFYAHWNLGRVVETVSDLDAALAEATSGSNRYREQQITAFAYTFADSPDGTAAQRGADAVASFVRQRRTVVGHPG